MAEINLFRTAENHRALEAGEDLFSVGDEAAEMYGVISGSIELFRGDEVLEVVEPGGVFGEVALLSDSKRSAGARAASDSVVAVVDQDEFLRLVKMNAFFSLEVMKVMAERLRRDG
jgi:trk system potassium uptake protein TrkA